MGYGSSPVTTPRTSFVNTLTSSSDAAPTSGVQTLGSGHLNASGGIGAQHATLRTSSPDASADAQGAQSFERLKKPSLSIGGRVAAAVTLVALGPTLAIGKGIAQLGATLLLKIMGERGGPEAAVRARDDLRTALGQHTPGTGQVLDRAVTIKDGSGTKQCSVMSLMNEYVDALNEDLAAPRVTKQEMETYVCMGEAIYKNLFGSDRADGQKPPVNVTVNGTTHQVPANLDTTRALSWYLQARGFADNAAPTRSFDDISLVASGAMFTKDPGNRLYDFLSSAPQCYGRCSTHCQERSANAGGGILKGFQAIWQAGPIATALGSIYGGQPVQHGIEDYDDKFPSKGGTLLFDKLHDSERDGVGEIYLKWEEVGTPTAYGFLTKHMDEADGFAARVAGNHGALGRILDHGDHYTQNANPVGYHGEKIDKGKAKEVFESFEGAIRGLDTNLLSFKDGEKLIKEGATFGAARIEHRLIELVDRAVAQGAHEADVDALKDALQEISAFIDAAGNDLGIVRKGGELHVGGPAMA